MYRSYTEHLSGVKFKLENLKSVSKQAGKRWCEVKPQLTGDVCCQCIHISQHYINFHPTFTLLPLEVWRYRHSGFEVYQNTKQENSPFSLPVPSFDQPTHPKIFFVFLSSLPNRSLLVKWVSEFLKGQDFAHKDCLLPTPITMGCPNLVQGDLGSSSMYQSGPFFLKKKGWAGEKRVVPCAHLSHPRTGTPHGWVFHFLFCARTGANGPVVLTVTRRTCAG